MLYFHVNSYEIMSLKLLANKFHSDEAPFEVHTYKIRTKKGADM